MYNSHSTFRLSSKVQVDLQQQFIWLRCAKSNCLWRKAQILHSLSGKAVVYSEMNQALTFHDQEYAHRLIYQCPIWYSEMILEGQTNPEFSCYIRQAWVWHGGWNGWKFRNQFHIPFIYFLCQDWYISSKVLIFVKPPL